MSLKNLKLKKIVQDNEYIMWALTEKERNTPIRMPLSDLIEHVERTEYAGTYVCIPSYPLLMPLFANAL